MTRVALTLQEAADRIGVTRSTLRKYKFIEPDVRIGNVSGYFPESVDAWNADRPGQGARVDLIDTQKIPAPRRTRKVAPRPPSAAELDALHRSE